MLCLNFGDYWFLFDQEDSRNSARNQLQYIPFFSSLKAAENGTCQGKDQMVTIGPIHVFDRFQGPWNLFSNSCTDGNGVEHVIEVTPVLRIQTDKANSKPLILFEDVDISFAEEIAKKAKGPVVLTANDKNHGLPENLETIEICFSLPSTEEVFSHIFFNICCFTVRKAKNTGDPDRFNTVQESWRKLCSRHADLKPYLDSEPVEAPQLLDITHQITNLISDSDLTHSRCLNFVAMEPMMNASGDLDTLHYMTSSKHVCSVISV
ncbi:Uncharacterized protein Rs2_17929 [Raphanus sativus]|nr:Uncharacterized protein Rs2_17929 [Raphanus sativus]